jgi:mannitol/fructose-specific phosphotransferase system IIA component (Ntr-type)
MTHQPQEAAGKPLLLSDLLPFERIALGVRVGTWREAIEQAGRLLFETGAVRFEYIAAMIKVAEELGPYIAIGPGIALPHARPEAGAKKSALSFVRLTEPVFFGNPANDPVDLVFALAAVDHTAHMVALQALAELFMSKELMAKLRAAGTAEAVTEVFREAERKVGT